MGEGAVGRNVEDGKRIFSIVDAALRENDGDKVDAGRSEEWERGGLSEELGSEVSR